MNGKNKSLIDFPDGLLFMRPEDDPWGEKTRKKVRFQEALAYAKKAWAEGRELTFEEMQQFVDE